VITLDRPPYEFTGRGWGYFDIKITIFWKNGQKSQVVHCLNFDEDETSSQLDIQFSE